MPNDTTSGPTDKSGKVNKPYLEFPLPPHPTGRWCKKIRGKIYYFGKLPDSHAALMQHLAQEDRC